MSALDLGALAIRNALYDIEDSEIGLNIVDLGLIRDVRLDRATGTAAVRMTLTARECPAGAVLVEGVRRRVAAVPGVSRVEVDVTFDPPWTPAEISADGRELLGR